MPTFADQLARVRALLDAEQPFPPDLGTWILRQLEDQVHADYTRARRDQYLRAAGERAGGSVSCRVGAIQHEAAILERRWSLYRYATPELATVRGAVHQARLIGGIPKRRRLFSILGAGVQSPGS